MGSPQSERGTCPPTAGSPGSPWGLFADWCAATGREAQYVTVADLAAFAADVSGAPSTVAQRVRAVAARLRAAGRLVEPSRQPQKAVWDTRPPLPAHSRTKPTATTDYDTNGDDGGWLDLAAALAAIRTVGWPSGLRGRRDGWLLVLAGIVGLPRRQMQQITVADITWTTSNTSNTSSTSNAGGGTLMEVCGVTVPGVDTPAACPRCAATRWLRSAATEEHYGRGALRNNLVQLAHQPAPTSHDCDNPRTDGWRAVRQLQPSIDRWGWIEDRWPISLRSISQVMAHRRHPDRNFDPAPAVRQPVTVAEPYNGMTLDELLAELDIKITARSAAVTDLDNTAHQAT